MVFEKSRQSLQYSAIYFQKFINNWVFRESYFMNLRSFLKFIISDL